MSFKETPKASTKNFLGEFVLKNYAPIEHKIGFHFESYHPKIKKPVIREKIRNLEISKKGYYLVYLPSFSDVNILRVLENISVEWKVFSKYTQQRSKIKNVEFFPIDESQFLNFFENCEGVLCNAGFELPAEALFLKKKLFVIPIKNQYEQECNAAALDGLGVSNSKELNQLDIENWVSTDKIIRVHYPNDIEEIILNEVLFF